MCVCVCVRRVRKREIECVCVCVCVSNLIRGFIAGVFIIPTGVWVDPVPFCCGVAIVLEECIMGRGTIE